MPMPGRPRPTGLAGLALLALFAAPIPGHGGGFGGGASEPEVKAAADEMAEAEYQPVRLPLSAAAARTWIALHETMVKPPADGTPFGEVIAALKAAARGKAAEAPFEWYLGPTELKEGEITMTTPISSPFVGREEVSLQTYLGFLLKPHGLEHVVHDGLLVIEIPCDDCPRKLAVTAAEAWAWRVLHEVVPLHFPDATPLKDVLEAAQRATAGKGKGGRGLVIHADPLGLREAEKNLDAPVSIDLERAPLCTALGLILQQLGLEFSVRGDGVVFITNRGGDDEEDSYLMDEAEAVASVQGLRYALFHEERNNRAEMRMLQKRLAHPDPTGKPAVGVPAHGFR